MRAIEKKLFRELWQMKGQALAIALVITSGVATFVMSLTTLDSLLITQSTYYRNYHFADVFASLKRAPDELRSRIAAIPGVDQVETRVVGMANIDVEGFDEPVVGQFTSISDAGQPLLNQLYIKSGRLVDAGRDDEVVLSDTFAGAHGLRPGDRISAVINGRGRTLRVVGLALSPEYIYQVGPGALFPDDKRFGVMWMARTPLGTAFDMDGAFNDVVLSLSADANLEVVLERLDNLLKPYGGLDAIGREDQLSHDYLSEEFRMLKTLATLFPMIFLGVAAFLLNVVVSRLIGTQREIIAALKAFGYSNTSVGVHYLKLVLLIVAAGVVGGLIAGAWLGRGMSEIYVEFYRFPFLMYEIGPEIALAGALISAIAATVGTLHAVRKAAQLPPAEAMRPEPPARYRETLVERVGLKRFLSQPSRMIARHIERQPMKSTLTVIGIAFSCAIMMLGSFQEDAIDFMMDVQYGLASREDMTISFVEPTSKRAVYDLLSLGGAHDAEVYRLVPARLRFGHRSRRTAIQGLEAEGELRRVLDARLQPLDLPLNGIVLTDRLAEILEVQPGDLLTVEVLEGSRPTLQVPVAGLVNEFVGLSAYMHRSTLNRLMREGETISGVYLTADSQYHSEIYRELKKMPRVAGTVVRMNAVKSFYETFAETVLVFAFINTLLAGTVAFGVVYNSARIAVAERGRELASLRVLGFSRGEISYIMLGELGLLTLIAIPTGFVIGRGLCGYIANNLQTDLYRVPLVLEPTTYAFAATVVLVAAILSGLIVRRRLDHLDLIAVLKTKE
ncbi:MAG: FtsX-like permease family protein [Gammaproteobacteria bacterium]|nr:FtsX-like permease family protein [Gammaproteobacteria bacterium]